MINAKPDFFSQQDKRWVNIEYSNHGDHHQTIGSSGSAIILVADIIAKLIDTSVTPTTLAQLSLNNGCRTYNSGTSWEFFKYVFKEYSFSKFVQSPNLEHLYDCVDNGGYVICCIKKGYWSRVGNYILVYGYDANNIYAIGTERKNGKQRIELFKHDIIMCFCFYK